MTNAERFITVVRRSAEPHEERLCDALEVALGALEACTGGDLASGEGIYKAEIAREAQQKIESLLGEK